MEISKIFTKRNLEVIHVLMKDKLHIRDIAARLRCSPAKVHNSIQLFKKYGLVEEVKEKNRKVIHLNNESELLKKIKNLLSTSDAEAMEEISIFDNISPLDFRYYGRSSSFEDLRQYLSESAFIRYLARVEVALTKALYKKGICTKEAYQEVYRAYKQITAEEVYKEEDRIKHNIRALANSIRKRVSDKSKPYVHFTVTSHDIICTAEALRCKEFSNAILIPELLKFEKTLIILAEREKDTLQIGRTHGQHADPITFGFAIAQYVDRLGHSILRIRRSANNLRGKIAGAVGAYNASSLFFSNPEEFEKSVLEELDLKASPISTQVVEPEFMLNYVHSVISSFGILANLSDDMRHLQRSEIGEVGEFFESKQVGSSTMPQKRNPINFENVKAMWKEFMPRISTVYMDQISEHQRDLTNSATSRFIPEILAAFYLSVNRLNSVMSRLVVDKANMKKNFDMNKDLIAAEPLYIMLAANGHPDAHEAVRELTLESQKTGIPMKDLIRKEQSLAPYLKKFNKKQIEIINNPESYTGISAKKTESICRFWRKELKV